MNLRLIFGVTIVALTLTNCDKDRVIPAGKTNYIEFGGEEGEALLESGKYYDLGLIDVNPIDKVDTNYLVRNFEVNNTLGFVTFSLASFFDTLNIPVGRYEPFSILDTVAPRSLKDVLVGAYFLPRASEDTLVMVRGFVDMEVLNETTMDVTYEFILNNEAVVKGNYNGLLLEGAAPETE
jgi:hypothetical protein